MEPQSSCASRKICYDYWGSGTLRNCDDERLPVGAGRLARIGGRQVLRMTCNPTTQTLYDRISHVLVA